MKNLLWIPVLATTCLASKVQAIDLTNGVIKAYPILNGQSPTIDGDLKDWDWNTAEPSWISEQTARLKNAQWALRYDDSALYVAVRASLPNRELSNPNSPQDAFWNADILQLRLAADPALSYPLDPNRDAGNSRIAHISFWKNTETGVDYLHINRGTKFDKGQEVNPVGSAISIRTHGTSHYILETRIPWSALDVPDGRNPFKTGDKMAGVLETLWIGGDSSRVAAVYRSNPGVFAFQNPGTWGQIEFVPAGTTPPKRPSLETLLAGFEAQSTTPKVEVGVPIVVNVPFDAKVSVNIFGPNGEVLRELVGGVPRTKGRYEVRFDGRDQWGQALKPGNYRWGAYFSKGLKAQYVGGVGRSGSPYYSTPDGKGGWGADHSDPIDAAADKSGLYFLWPVGEGSRPIVKTDYEGKVLWRKNPNVGGGFGPFYAIASNEKYVYLTLGDTNARLVRLDAATGQLLTWGDKGPSELPLGEGRVVEVPHDSSPLTFTHYGSARISQPESVGLAAQGGLVFVSRYSQNKIAVIDSQTGQIIRELSCSGPRGLTLGSDGALYAVSYVPNQTPKIVRFDNAQGEATPVVTQNLVAPWDVAVDGSGNLNVSDLGASQQVKVFDKGGQLVKSLGTLGGRSWQGRYDGKGFLHPSGLTTDARGGLVVAETAIPKVFTRFDTKSGAAQKRWFGSPVYWSSTWPSPDDPRKVFTLLTGGIGQYQLPEKGGDQDKPEAYYALEEAGYPHADDYTHDMGQPQWVRANNGLDYLISDMNPHTISVKQADKLRPVAHFRVVNNWAQGNTSKKNYLQIWIDGDGDGQVQATETTKLETIAGKPAVAMSDLTDSLTMQPNGDLYFMTQANSILKIPALSIGSKGLLKWDLAAASYVIPSVLPSKKEDLSTTARHGLHGARLDKSGNLYTVFNTTVAGNGQPFEYATPELAKQMKEGMGHTATFNVVKVAKFDPNGKLFWMAGRKATAAAKDGEMYHFWNMAGLVNNNYIAGGSEWGPIYFYTHDGFYVDALMNNPGLNPPPGPYTFGGETSGGRVQYFPKQDELWAYSSGMAYKVEGFKNGKVEGEARASGTVLLDKIYDAPTSQTAAVVSPLQIVPLVGQPLTDARSWDGVSSSNLTREGTGLASAQIGYDAQYLYARIRVTDSSPLQNEADTLASAFKGGDSVALVLGPTGERQQAAAGDVRLMATQIAGKPVLLAMKAVTSAQKRSETYFTPAGGEAKFEFVDEIPGGKLALTPDAAGYTATFAVPRSFLEFELVAGKQLRGDIEVRLSGNGQRGLQVTGRHYLFTPATQQTTMVDDVPTEARMYPDGWGKVEVK